MISTKAVIQSSGVVIKPLRPSSVAYLIPCRGIGSKGVWIRTEEEAHKTIQRLQLAPGDICRLTDFHEQYPEMPSMLNGSVVALGTKLSDYNGSRLLHLDHSGKFHLFRRQDDFPHHWWILGIKEA